MEKNKDKKYICGKKEVRCVWRGELLYYFITILITGISFSANNVNP